MAAPRDPVDLTTHTIAGFCLLSVICGTATLVGCLAKLGVLW